MSWTNFDRLDLALDEVVVGVGALLVKVSLSLLLPLWRERFDQATMELTIEENRDEIILMNVRAAVMSGGQRALSHCVI